MNNTSGSHHSSSPTHGSLAIRIHAEYARRIREGKIPPGERMPQIREVAAAHRVGLRTAARAYEMLQADGLIFSRKSVGTFVQETLPAASPRPEIYCCMSEGVLRGRLSLGIERLKGAILAADRRGASLHVVDSPGQFLPLMMPRPAPVGALFLAPPNTSDTFTAVDEYVQRNAVPCCIMLGAQSRIPHIRTRRDAGFEILTRHLLDLGHRHIALLNGSRAQGGWALPVRRMNRAGWLRALTSAGVSPAPGEYMEIPVESIIPEEAPTRSALEQLLALRPRPTALLCTNDHTALLAMRLLAERGIAVPGEVSVAGFDGVPEGESSRPRLTTADQRLQEQGAMAVNYVLDLLEGRKPQNLAVLPRLVVRDSTAPPPGGAAAQVEVTAQVPE